MADSPKLWDPSRLLNLNPSGPPFAVIILNQPILSDHKETVKHLWENATLRLCADGGANRLYDVYGDDIALPHEVRGDLDSLRNDVSKFYSSKGVKIVTVSSQYATDLQKCILRVEEFEEERAKLAKSEGGDEMDLVIVGGLSGRLDQTMHTLHVLCQVAQSNSPKTTNLSAEEKKKSLEQDDFAVLNRRERAWVLSENSLVWLLNKGSHLIKVDLEKYGQTCGLMPMISQVQTSDAGTRIWTKGLRWDLDGTPSAIGGFLSTSNHLKENQVHVTTEAEIIWTMEVRKD